MTRNSNPSEGRPSAGRDPANKKFKLLGTDTTTKEKRRIEFIGVEEPAAGSIVTGTDRQTGKPVTVKVSGRDPAN